MIVVMESTKEIAVFGGGSPIAKLRSRTSLQLDKSRLLRAPLEALLLTGRGRVSSKNNPSFACI